MDSFKQYMHAMEIYLQNYSIRMNCVLCRFNLLEKGRNNAHPLTFKDAHAFPFNLQ